MNVAAACNSIKRECFPAVNVPLGYRSLRAYTKRAAHLHLQVIFTAIYAASIAAVRFFPTPIFYENA
jgi:hypothetical protein